MRITQLVSNLHPVNPYSGKAIYSHTGVLSNGLTDRGHEVHLFAPEESQTRAQLHSTGPALYHLPLPEDIRRYHIFNHLSAGYEFSRKNQVDIIHSHFNLLSCFFSKLIDVPTIASVHSPIEDRIKPFLEQHKDNYFISFSLAQRTQLPELNWYANIYHGVDTNVFAYDPEPEDYFLYLGRITADKGVHLAIEAAKLAGVKLRIAGSSYPAEGYWQKHVEPHINGDSIRYFGEMSFESKIPLLQKARGLLFPTQVAEAFGYSMIEAMSCGTPVIGFNNGSVAEIVKHGSTGFVVENAEEMAEAIGKIDQIKRADVRDRATTYFSVDKMVSGYERVYERVLRNHR